MSALSSGAATSSSDVTVLIECLREAGGLAHRGTLGGPFTKKQGQNPGFKKGSGGNYTTAVQAAKRAGLIAVECKDPTRPMIRLLAEEMKVAVSPHSVDKDTSAVLPASPKYCLIDTPEALESVMESVDVFRMSRNSPSPPPLPSYDDVEHASFNQTEDKYDFHHNDIIEVEHKHQDNCLLEDVSHDTSDEKQKDQTPELVPEELPELPDDDACLDHMQESKDQAVSPLDGVVVALDCEGSRDAELALVQVATSEQTFIFDCVRLGADVVAQALEPLLTDTKRIKLVHDVHFDAHVLRKHGIVLKGVLDTQLVYEYLNGDLHAGFNKLLEVWELPLHQSKKDMHSRMDRDVNMWAKRPLSSVVLQYAADDVRLLLGMHEAIRSRVAPLALTKLCAASCIRAELSETASNIRHLSFSHSGKTYSLELARAMGVSVVAYQAAQVDESETPRLLALLPDTYQQAIQCLGGFRGVTDVVLDRGRRPHLFRGAVREFLFADERTLMEQCHVDAVVATIGEDRFGSDNRAGMDRSLHRISAMRDSRREGMIYGLTLRAGRPVVGSATLLHDILFGSPDKSILIVGKPGSGKTTIIRDITRALAETQNVCVVDTSNEIAGDGMVPHPCVGLARRMIVPDLKHQGRVMIECVQNHTPHVMVIDEIGRPEEVEAARTVKQRGVRIVASAHGSFRSLLKNGQLKGLVGGTAEVIKTGGIREVQRAGEPTFDVVVELDPEHNNQMIVVNDVAAAVDSILRGRDFRAQCRRGSAEHRCICLKLIQG